MKANLRTEFQSGSDYYQLLDIARKIEGENMPIDSTTETNKPANSKGKPKVGAITVDSTTAQQLSHLQGAVKGLTNLVKEDQLNTNTTQSSQNLGSSGQGSANWADFVQFTINLESSIYHGAKRKMVCEFHIICANCGLFSYLGGVHGFLTVCMCTNGMDFASFII